MSYAKIAYLENHSGFIVVQNSPSPQRRTHRCHFEGELCPPAPSETSVKQSSTIKMILHCRARLKYTNDGFIDVIARSELCDESIFYCKDNPTLP
jgi:hypothetical protein